MKIPVNKKYLDIVFHITLTFILIYISKLAIDFFAFTLSNADYVGKWLKAVTAWFFSVFSTVFIGFVIAYILDPAADFFQERFDNIFYKAKKRRWEENRSHRRTAGVLITYFSVFIVITAFIFFIAQKLSLSASENLINQLINAIDIYLKKFLLAYRRLNVILGKYGIASDYLNIFSDNIGRYTVKLSNSFTELLSSVGNWLANIFIGIFIGFYFLRDKERIVNKTKEIISVFFSEKTASSVFSAANDIHTVFSGFIRGQLLDGAIMSVLISFGLSVINVPYAVFIGIFSGFSNIIPYFGAIMGFILAVAVSLISGTAYKAVYCAVYIFLLQQLDSFVIVPRVVGNNVELSPVLVLIALAVGGQMFGIVGLIFAVPVFAAAKIFLSRFFCRKKQEYVSK